MFDRGQRMFGQACSSLGGPAMLGDLDDTWLVCFAPIKSKLVLSLIKHLVEENSFQSEHIS